MSSDLLFNKDGFSALIKVTKGRQNRPINKLFPSTSRDQNFCGTENGRQSVSRRAMHIG